MVSKNVWEMFLEVLKYVVMPAHPLPDAVMPQNPTYAHNKVLKYIYSVLDTQVFQAKILINHKNRSKVVLKPFMGFNNIKNGFYGSELTLVHIVGFPRPLKFKIRPGRLFQPSAL